MVTHVVAPSLRLPNLGNTCYANAVFQLLAASPSFRDNLRSEDDADDEARRRGLVGADDRTALASALLAATRELIVDGRSDRTKSVLRRFAAMTTRSGFRVHDSNDAQEFLVLFLELLRASSTRGFRLANKPDNFENPSVRDMMKANWDAEIGASFFSPLACLQSQYLSETRCGNCSYATHSAQVHTVLPVSPRSTIETSVAEFFADEGVEDWRCDRCGEKHPDTRKKMWLWRPSRVLVLNVTRFLPDGRKDATPVSASDFLDLTPFCASGARRPPRVRYGLRAVVDHTGRGRAGGHYTCDAMRVRDTVAEDDAENVTVRRITWDRLDDDDEAVGGGASRRGNSTSYLLLYEAYIAER